MPDIDVALLEALLSRLVPADGHGPDAAGIGLPGFVLGRLGGARRSAADTYAAGLRDLDVRARVRWGHGFVEASGAERDAVIADVEAAESGLPPWGRADAFFESVLRDVREGMFGDPSYGGNRDAAGWDLLGYPDPRRVWSEHEQRVDVVVIPLHPRAATPPAPRPRLSGAEVAP